MCYVETREKRERERVREKEYYFDKEKVLKSFQDAKQSINYYLILGDKTFCRTGLKKNEKT